MPKQKTFMSSFCVCDHQLFPALNEISNNVFNQGFDHASLSMITFELGGVNMLYPHNCAQVLKNVQQRYMFIRSSPMDSFLNNNPFLSNITVNIIFD